MNSLSLKRVLGLLAAACLSSTMASANPESERLRAGAYALAYNLDYDEATRQMEAAVRADPQDPAAERGLAVIPWLLITFGRGTATVDDYLGSLSRQTVSVQTPPADLAARFTTHIQRALTLSEKLVEASPRDPEALYQLGEAVALRASYLATVDGKILGGFRAARRAYDVHEDVLALASARKDAGLTVGMYRYFVGVMSLPMRMMAYVAGFGGGKERGLQMIEEAAAFPSEAQSDAKLALVLLYNRDGNYDAALRTLGELQRMFPRNRLLRLEAGATALRAGRPADAERELSAGIVALASDPRPRMFGEEALWYQKRGAARRALNHQDAADTDLRHALTLESRRWVAGRTHAELGKLADLRHDRVAARAHFEKAVALAEQDADPIGADEARQWIATPFRSGR